MDYKKMTKEELLNYIEECEMNSGKYGLIWDKEKDSERIVVDCDKNIPILKEENSKEISKKGCKNILIEGDNFHALSVLNYTHNENIDMIYIDPPYNTGNKDFIYNDKFVDLEDGYRHSKWLNFMQKRLRLARNLLKEDGIIFVSIDENEFAQLKLLCDKIFNENNLVAIFNWKKTSTPPSLSKNVRKKYEYILCYKKCDFNRGLNGGEVEGGDMPLLNESNSLATLEFDKESVYFKIPDGTYVAGEKDRVVLEKTINIVNGKSDKNIILKGHFKWIKSTLDEEISKGTKFWIKSDKFAIRYQREGIRTKVPSNIISKEECEVGTNEEATAELKKLFNTKSEVFSHPKPTSLIKYLVDMVTYNNKEAIILDFFAGSGTTAQAVLELNKADGGNRKFIICTNNENNICENITYPRIKTVISGIRNDGTKYSDGLEASLKYFKTDFVENFANRDQLYFDLTERCIPMLCMKNDCYCEYKVTNEYKIYSNQDKSLFTCVYFDMFGDKEKEFIEEIKNIDQLKKVYKFSLGDIIDETLFTGVKNYQIEAIPYKIIELYKQLIKLSKGD